MQHIWTRKWRTIWSYKAMKGIWDLLGIHPVEVSFCRGSLHHCLWHQMNTLDIAISILEWLGSCIYFCNISLESLTSKMAFGECYILGTWMVHSSFTGSLSSWGFFSSLGSLQYIENIHIFKQSTGKKLLFTLPHFIQTSKDAELGRICDYNAKIGRISHLDSILSIEICD